MITLNMSTPDENCGPVLHVLVVGFHHKRGCQVEYSYPPLIAGHAVDSHELPEEWRYLPPMALPDGAHNTTKDTIFFHLPSRERVHSTVFGISCYRQIDAHELLNRANDVTRNTVQKSVCVLSTLPLYGLIKAKLELITHAYFKERDFSQVSLLEETYINLNASLNMNMVHGPQVYLGLSGRDLVQHFKHKVMTLFKLILLERRVLFFTAPVEPICSTMLSVLSLFPGLIENGLVESAHYSPDRCLSSHLKVTKVNSGDCDDYLEVHYHDTYNMTNSHSKQSVAEAQCSPLSSPSEEAGSDDNSAKVHQHKPDSPLTDADSPSSGHQSVTPGDTNGTPQDKKECHNSETKDKASSGAWSLQRSFSLQEDDLKPDKNMEDLLEAEDCFNWNEDKLLLEIDDNALSPSGDEHRNPSPNPADPHKCDITDRGLGLHKSEWSVSKDSIPLSSSSSSSSIGGKPGKDKTKKKRGKKHRRVHVDDRPPSPSTLNIDDYGFPLSVFTKGNLCHPYLCLQYYDLLSDVNVRGFLIGATNQLFKQKRHLVDVVVEIAEAKVDINDAELRKQLTLTTADLRFADFLVRNVSDDRGDIFLDDTEWEGGDEWLRGQFRIYLLAMLATVHQNEEKLVEDFNPHFVSAWKTTHNYKVWTASKVNSIKKVEPGHPFHGQLSMSDMKLKFSHSMQSTERGKKLNAAVQQTGRAMYNTTKVVGGALTSAKSAMSSWFSGLGGGHSPHTETLTQDTNS